MLTSKVLDVFAMRDTADQVAILREGSLLGTNVGDAIFAHMGNYPERKNALIAALGSADFASAA